MNKMVLGLLLVGIVTSFNVNATTIDCWGRGVNMQTSFELKKPGQVETEFRLGYDTILDVMPGKMIVQIESVLAPGSAQKNEIRTYAGSYKYNGLEAKFVLSIELDANKKQVGIHKNIFNLNQQNIGICGVSSI